VSPVKYELDLHSTEDDILHSYHSENAKSYTDIGFFVLNDLYNNFN
jgi:hypothetical protein